MTRNENINEAITKTDLFQHILTSNGKEDIHFLRILIESLRNSHKIYLSKKIPEIQQSISLLSQKFSDKHAFFNFLATLFKRYEQGLLEHIKEEEDVIFPYVVYLMNCKGILDQAKTARILKGSKSLQDFIQSHSDTEAPLDNFIEMLQKVQKEVNDCYPFNVLVRQITWLRDDLNRHAFYEDEILVKTALRLESDLLSGNNYCIEV